MGLAPVPLLGHLHAAAALTERRANGGLRNIVSWRVENLEGDREPASHCLYFTAMQSAQSSSGSSRKGFFCPGIGLFSLGLFECFDLLLLLFSWAFSPCWRGSFYYTPVMVTRARSLLCQCPGLSGTLHLQTNVLIPSASHGWQGSLWPALAG